MLRTRLGLRTLGLCSLVLGLMAFAGTGVAQAEEHETGPCWGYINPSTLKLECFSKVLEAEPVIEIENKTATLLIANQTFSILCTSAVFDEGGQLSAEGKILLGRLKFKGCVTLIKGVISKPCEPFNGTEKGVILTEKIEGELKLHELAGGVKDSTILVKPDVKEGALLVIHPGAECSVGEEILVKGEWVLWDCKNEPTVHKVTHLLEEFPGLKLIKVGANQATIDGSFNVSLGGAHLGYQWAFLAG